MRDLFDKADEIPVTLVVLIAYVTIAFLTGPLADDDGLTVQMLWLTPMTVSEGQPWRLLSSSFVHGGLLHVVMNSWALVVLGPPVERALGSLRFTALYLLAQLGSSLAVCVVYAPRQPVVGGSGAIFGILGAIVAMQMRQGRSALSFLDYDGPRRMLGMIVVYLVIGFFLPIVSNTAHVGGLIGGFAFTFLFLVQPRHAPRRLGAWRLAIAALFAGLTFHAMVPVTRYDWLWNRSVDEPSMARRAELQRAAVMSWRGRADVTLDDRRAFEDVELERPK